jgi:hypothetical protein
VLDISKMNKPSRMMNRHTPAVVCVDVGGGGAYALKHVHVPDCVLPELERKAVASQMVALGESRFHGQPGGMPAARGESIIPRRGAKHSSGDLRMYGTRSLNGKHVHRYNPAVEEEEECTRSAGAHALALSALEWVVIPDAAHRQGGPQRATSRPLCGPTWVATATRSRAH